MWSGVHSASTPKLSEEKQNKMTHLEKETQPKIKFTAQIR
jgi:hypothetical protein